MLALIMSGILVSLSAEPIKAGITAGVRGITIVAGVLQAVSKHMASNWKYVVS